MIDSLREQCSLLIKSDSQKYSKIATFLENDNCFFEIDMETSYAILSDLLVKEEDIARVYQALIRVENFRP